jgi:hypothetical protein
MYLFVYICLSIYLFVQLSISVCLHTYLILPQLHPTYIYFLCTTTLTPTRPSFFRRL